MAIVSRTAKATLEPLLKYLSNIYSAQQLDELLEAYSVTRRSSFRLNTLKLSSPDEQRQCIAELARSLQASKKTKGARLTPTPFSPLAFAVSDPSVNIRHFRPSPYYKNGQIFFQSLSSMLPPLALGVEPGMSVLDMCAAPGGKTLQLAELVGKRGSVVANDINVIRASILAKNVDTVLPTSLRRLVKIRIVDATRMRLSSAPEIDLSAQTNDELPDSDMAPVSYPTVEEIEELARQHQKMAQEDSNTRNRIFDRPFDAILLDAPCTGEGVIHLSHPSSYKSWSRQWVLQHSRLQRQLLKSAHALLKPGGSLVYSTCTLGTEENEAVVDWFLKRYSDMAIVPLGGAMSQFAPSPAKGMPKKGVNLWNDGDDDDNPPQPLPTGFGPGIVRVPGGRFHPSLRMALRVFPSEDYEGFFVCRLQKAQ
ncbi:S-adenosyl-L-methionine-dependent methyltransferase [Polychytrium aggregatum]|uniref:S-adenosyl-L-methionine-dependent methyltransferase n=1 Tax=Polychytrium aggregatum TaxID=110093 RepID=UPI0022FEF583|nr:S-adenosyl-L-methionine-dependent methyltransferase [Polychytrium aggregatum]KAI9205943.1 S-adenosyl-L-methionine-dependent methyltransferase [Polychytrium aggregatum]